MPGKKTKNKYTAAGQPRKFQSPEDMKVAIDKYFKKEKGVWTICDLTEALGFCSRSALLDYEGYTKEYYGIIKAAKNKIEAQHERNLSQGQCTGSIFYLKNAGWSDKQQIEHSGNMGVSIVNFKDSDKVDPDKDK